LAQIPPESAAELSRHSETCDYDVVKNHERFERALSNSSSLSRVHFRARARSEMAELFTAVYKKKKKREKERKKTAFPAPQNWTK